MKEIKLSSGAIITAYVGDGWDGISGIFIETNPPKQEVTLTKNDKKNLVQLLKYYVKEEMGLRLEEGQIYGGYKNEKPVKINQDSFSANPYQVQYLIGTLLEEKREINDIQ